MDSDSDSNSSVHSLETAAFRSSATIPPSSSLDDLQFERGPRGEQFLIVNHTANQRNGSEVSRIWLHSGERRRMDNRSNDRYWRRNHCKKLLTPERNQLMEDIIEACECLKAWWKKELIQQQKD